MDIRTIAINLAKTDGLINITRVGLCEAAGIPDGSFAHVVGMTFGEFIESLRTDPAVQSASPAGRLNRRRTNRELRKEHLIESGIRVAGRVGYRAVTKILIAEEAGVSHALVNRYFHTMNQVRQAIMRRAVQLEIPEIVAQGLADRDTQALKAPEELKRRALQTLAG